MTDPSPDVVAELREMAQQAAHDALELQARAAAGERGEFGLALRPGKLWWKAILLLEAAGDISDLTAQMALRLVDRDTGRWTGTLAELVLSAQYVIEPDPTKAAELDRQRSRL